MRLSSTKRSHFRKRNTPVKRLESVTTNQEPAEIGQSLCRTHSIRQAVDGNRVE